MMTKWDTIQADVADMYIGQIENEEWEKAYADSKSDDYIGADDLFDQDDLLTLDWEG